MSDQSLNQLPLRELFVHAEHQARDLAEHLELNFLPKLTVLDESVHPKTEDQAVRDITVRSRAAQVLESDIFTQQLLQKMHDCLNAIDAKLRQRAD